MNRTAEALTRARMRLLRSLQPARTMRYQAWRWLQRKLVGVPGVEAAPLQRTTLPGVRIVKIIVPETRTLELPIPAQPDGGTHAFFRDRSSFPVFERCLARMKGARIHAPDGFLYLPDGRVLLEHHFFFREHIENHNLYFTRRPPARGIDGPVFPLIGFCPGAHYHWMTEVLYRLHGCLDDLPRDTRFLIPSKVSKVHRDALETFGIGSERLLGMEHHDHFEFSDLWYSSPVTKSGYDVPEVARWVRDVFAAHGAREDEIAASASARPEMLYITRRLASRRRIVNEAKLIAMLTAAGMACIECEKLSFAEQRAMFSRARIVIAPHGAGLVNLLFAPLGGRLLEIHPEEIPTGATCYWSIANALGWSYHHLRGSISARGADSSDISVSVAGVQSWLANALAAPASVR
ncbi:MAG: glycosyltransferase family 61 protein [Opitutaceae bacterium]